VSRKRSALIRPKRGTSGRPLWPPPASACGMGVWSP
jgi:hypothetical protein